MLTAASRVLRARRLLAMTRQETRGLQSKVCLLGCAGAIGQPLSLLLSRSNTPHIRELSMYDTVPTEGVRADLCSIDTTLHITAHMGVADGLASALHDADIVVIPVGYPRPPSTLRSELFVFNAPLVAHLLRTVAAVCPAAWVLLTSNPLNSLVPLAAEILKDAGVFNPRRLFGVCTLDAMRATRVLFEAKGRVLDVPVIGGRTLNTIVPLYSQIAVGGAGLPEPLTDAEAREFAARVRHAGTAVVEKKSAPATLSVAAALSRFVLAAAAARAGEHGVTEYAMVNAPSRGLPFFGQRVELGSDGWVAADSFEQADLSAEERRLLVDCLESLRGDLARGRDEIVNLRKAWGSAPPSASLAAPILGL